AAGPAASIKKTGEPQSVDGVGSPTNRNQKNTKLAHRHSGSDQGNSNRGKRWDRSYFDDLKYLNAESPAISSSTHWPSDELARLEANIRNRVKGGDDFVTVPIPQSAGSDQRSMAAAAASYQKEREIVDARLVRKVTIGEKGVSFNELCRK